MQRKFTRYLIIFIAIGPYSCKNNNGAHSKGTLYKGVYSFGPEMKTFTECNSGHEYWVADSCKQLELQYNQLKFEKPYEPVYIEIQGNKVRSGKDGLGSEYDSTLVVNKLIKITKEIPQDMCN
jgi:copper homeostasis protein (lipoprotein)